MPEFSNDGLPIASPQVDFTKEINSSALKDQSVLITGGASGIGQAFAESLAEAGAYVTIFDLQDEPGKAIVSSLSEKGHKVQFIQGDVCSWDDQIRAFDAAVSFSPFRALDIVLLVAGIRGESILRWLKSPTSDDGKLIKPDTNTIDINLTAVWHATHLALHYFRQSLQQETRTTSSKQLVFVGSLAGYLSIPYSTSYGASKWGVRGIWRAICGENNLLGENATTPFRTSLIAPWFVRTNMTQSILPTLHDVGIVYAEPADCVDVMMRIVCDEQVSGRAIAVAPKKKSFDLCDDSNGLDGGEVLQAKLVEGVFGSSGKSVNDFYTGNWKPKGW